MGVSPPSLSLFSLDLSEGPRLGPILRQDDAAHLHGPHTELCQLPAGTQKPEPALVPVLCHAPGRPQLAVPEHHGPGHGGLRAGRGTLRHGHQTLWPHICPGRSLDSAWFGDRWRAGLGAYTDIILPLSGQHFPPNLYPAGMTRLFNPVPSRNFCCGNRINFLLWVLIFSSCLNAETLEGGRGACGLLCHMLLCFRAAFLCRSRSFGLFSGFGGHTQQCSGPQTWVNMLRTNTLPFLLMGSYTSDFKGSLLYGAQPCVSSEVLKSTCLTQVGPRSQSSATP